MKIYELNGPGFDEGPLFFPTAKQAIAYAKENADEFDYVKEHEIGHLTRDVACRLASGRGYSLASKEIWRHS